MTLRDYLDNEHLSYLWNKIKAKFLSLSGGDVVGDVSFGNGDDETAPTPLKTGLSMDSYFGVASTVTSCSIMDGFTTFDDVGAYPVKWVLFEMDESRHISAASNVTISVASGSPDPYLERSGVISAQVGTKEKLPNRYDDVPLFEGEYEVGRLMKMRLDVGGYDGVYCVAEIIMDGSIADYIYQESVSSGQCIKLQFDVTTCLLATGSKKMALKVSDRDMLPVYGYLTRPDRRELPEYPCVIVLPNGDALYGYEDEYGSGQIRDLGEDQYISKSLPRLGPFSHIYLARWFSTPQAQVHFVHPDDDTMSGGTVVGSVDVSNDPDNTHITKMETWVGMSHRNFISMSVNDSTGALSYEVGSAKAFREAIRALTYIGETKTGSNLNSMPWGAIWWGQNFTNAPDAASGSTYWYRVISYDGVQIAMRFLGNTTAPYLYIRTYTNSVWQPWRRCDNEQCLQLSGGTMTGNLRLRTQNYSANTTAPSSTVDQDVLNIYDKDGRRVWCVNYWHTTANVLNFRLWAQRYINGTTYYNMITLAINGSGGLSVGVSSAAAWRSAIGAAASSDRRLKSDIHPLGQEAVAFVENLKPYVYTINGERQVGLIAQDVHEADPWETRMAFETQEGIDGLDDWEKMEDGSPTWKLDYVRIIPPLVAAVKEANSRIAQLEAEIAELKKEIQALARGEGKTWT